MPGAPHRGVPRSKPCEGLPAILQPVGSKGAHVDVGLVSQTFYRALPGVLYEGVPGASYAIVSGAPYGAAPGKSYGPWQSCVCTSCLYHSARGVTATSDGVAPGASDGAVPGAPHRGVPSLHERDEEGADLRRKTCWAATKKKPARWGGTAKGEHTRVTTVLAHSSRYCQCAGRGKNKRPAYPREHCKASLTSASTFPCFSWSTERFPARECLIARHSSGPP